MTTKDYTYLLNRPYSLNDRQAAELENILMEFPYLQSARAVYLKGLYNKDSFRYNNELKKTAAYTTDRTILFEFITSEGFRGVNQNEIDAQEKALAEITVLEETVAPAPTESLPEEPTLSKPESNVDKLEHSIKMLIKEAVPEAAPIAEKPSVTEEPANIITFETIPAPTIPETEKTEQTPDAVGSPLKFDQNEKHSFAEWLQLSRLKPIERTTDNNTTGAEPAEEKNAEPETTQEQPNALDKKLELIDRFIETSPKIAPVKSDNSAWENLSKKTTDTPGIMTETLARVYLEQKKYAKAIQAYEILILKYPEKSVFFANRISEVKDLQQNNT